MAFCVTCNDRLTGKVTGYVLGHQHLMCGTRKAEYFLVTMYRAAPMKPSIQCTPGSLSPWMMWLKCQTNHTGM